MEWTDMVHYQQQMQKIIRFLLPVRKSVSVSYTHLDVYKRQH